MNIKDLSKDTVLKSKFKDFVSCRLTKLPFSYLCILIFVIFLTTFSAENTLFANLFLITLKTIISISLFVTIYYYYMLFYYDYECIEKEYYFTSNNKDYYYVINNNIIKVDNEELEKIRIRKNSEEDIINNEYFDEEY